MWLPNFGYTFWEPVENSEACRNSKADNTERIFYIGFLLEDRLRNRIGDSYFDLPELIEINLDTVNQSIRLRLEKNEHNRLKSIQCKITSTSYINAVRDCCNLLNKLFSLLSLQYDSPLSIYSLYAFDDTHKAKWRCYPQFGESELLKIPSLINLGKPFRILLSIYREGKNSRSPFYSFLCFYKILEALYQHKQIFAKSDKIIKENNLNIKRPSRRITREMLALSMTPGLWPKFENITYRKFFNLLRADYKVKIAHILPTRKGLGWINLDDFELFNEFSTLSNLTDLVSRDIVNDELNIWQTFVFKSIATI